MSSTLLQYSKIEIFWKNIFRKNYILKKMDRVARRGSLARAPGALKFHNAEKNWKGGPFGIFQHPFCRKTSKKMQGDPLGKNFFSKKKSRSAEKNERGESLVSLGMVCYAEKQEKPFWFSSLDQIVHCDAIIFYRTFGELFWSVRVDRKKRVTIIVAFHFMKRRLKIGVSKKFRPRMNLKTYFSKFLALCSKHKPETL